MAFAAVIAFVVQVLLVSLNVVLEEFRRVCFKGSALSTFAILVPVLRVATSPARPILSTLPIIALTIPLLVAPTVLRTPHFCDNPNMAEENKQEEATRIQGSKSG